jgi:hypothetical protein
MCSNLPNSIYLIPYDEPQITLGLVDEFIAEPKLEATKKLNVENVMVFAQKINAMQMYVSVSVPYNCLAVSFSGFSDGNGFRCVTNREYNLVSTLTLEIRYIMANITRGQFTLDCVLCVYDNAINKRILNP